MSTFANVSLMILSVSGVCNSGAKIVENKTNIPIPRTMPKKMEYICARPIITSIMNIIAMKENTYTSNEVMLSTDAICAIMLSNWAICYGLNLLDFECAKIFRLAF